MSLAAKKSRTMSPITTGQHDSLNDIQDVSSEKFQLLWAKVLAGEVERPGSTSIRTLSILKNIDQATADLFRKFYSACVVLKDDARVPSLRW